MVVHIHPQRLPLIYHRRRPGEDRLERGHLGSGRLRRLGQELAPVLLLLLALLLHLLLELLLLIVQQLLLVLLVELLQLLLLVHPEGGHRPSLLLQLLLPLGVRWRQAQAPTTRRPCQHGLSLGLWI